MSLRYIIGLNLTDDTDLDSFNNQGYFYIKGFKIFDTNNYTAYDVSLEEFMSIECMDLNIKSGITDDALKSNRLLVDRFGGLKDTHPLTTREIPIFYKGINIYNYDYVIVNSRFCSMYIDLSDYTFEVGVRATEFFEDISFTNATIIFYTHTPECSTFEADCLMEVGDCLTVRGTAIYYNGYGLLNCHKNISSYIIDGGTKKLYIDLEYCSSDTTIVLPTGIESVWMYHTSKLKAPLRICMSNKSNKIGLLSKILRCVTESHDVAVLDDLDILLWHLGRYRIGIGLQ